MWLALNRLRAYPTKVDVRIIAKQTIHTGHDTTQLQYNVSWESKQHDGSDYPPEWTHAEDYTGTAPLKKNKIKSRTNPHEWLTTIAPNGIHRNTKFLQISSHLEDITKPLDCDKESS